MYTIAVPNSEITQHIGDDNLERVLLKSYGHLHFKMEDSAGATTLTNSGVHTSATADLTGGSFVKVGFMVDFSHARFRVGDLGMHISIL